MRFTVDQVQGVRSTLDDGVVVVLDGGQLYPMWIATLEGETFAECELLTALRIHYPLASWESAAAAERDVLERAEATIDQWIERLTAAKARCRELNGIAAPPDETGGATALGQRINRQSDGDARA